MRRVTPSPSLQVNHIYTFAIKYLQVGGVWIFLILYLEQIKKLLKCFRKSLEDASGLMDRYREFNDHGHSFKSFPRIVCFEKS